MVRKTSKFPWKRVFAVCYVLSAFIAARVWFLHFREGDRLVSLPTMGVDVDVTGYVARLREEGEGLDLGRPSGGLRDVVGEKVGSFLGDEERRREREKRRLARGERRGQQEKSDDDIWEEEWELESVGKRKEEPVAIDSWGVSQVSFAGKIFTVRSAIARFHQGGANEREERLLEVILFQSMLSGAQRDALIEVKGVWSPELDEIGVEPLVQLVVSVAVDARDCDDNNFAKGVLRFNATQIEGLQHFGSLFEYRFSPTRVMSGQSFALRCNALREGQALSLDFSGQTMLLVGQNGSREGRELSWRLNRRETIYQAPLKPVVPHAEEERQ